MINRYFHQVILYLFGGTEERFDSDPADESECRAFSERIQANFRDHLFVTRERKVYNVNFTLLEKTLGP